MASNLEAMASNLVAIFAVFLYKQFPGKPAAEVSYKNKLTYRSVHVLSNMRVQTASACFCLLAPLLVCFLLGITSASAAFLYFNPEEESATFVLLVFEKPK